MSWNTTQHFKIMKYTYINLIIRTKTQKKANCSFTAKTVKIRTTQHFKLMKYTYINLIITTKPKKFKEQPINWKQQEIRTRNLKKTKGKKKIKLPVVGSEAVEGQRSGSTGVQKAAETPACRRQTLRCASGNRCGTVCGNRVCEGIGFVREWVRGFLNCEGNGDCEGWGSDLRGKWKQKLLV